MTLKGITQTTPVSLAMVGLLIGIAWLGGGKFTGMEHQIAAAKTIREAADKETSKWREKITLILTELKALSAENKRRHDRDDGS